MKVIVVQLIESNVKPFILLILLKNNVILIDLANGVPSTIVNLYEC